MILSPGHAEHVAETMRALASPSRLRILARLDEAPCAVGQLEAELGIPQATVSNHLRILRHLNLVVGERDGRSVTYRIADEHVSELLRQAAHHVGHGEAAAAD